MFVFAGQTSPGDFHMVAFDRPQMERVLDAAGLVIDEYVEPHAPQSPLRGQINMHLRARPATLGH